MIDVGLSIVINRPLNEVFALLSDLEKNLKWRASQEEVTKMSEGPIGVGTTYRTVNHVLSQRMEGESEVTEYELNRKITFISKSGYFPFEVQRSFEAVEGGTRVTFTMKAEPASVIKLAEPLVATMAKRRAGADIANLKDLMEAQAL
jgi:uncharacterized membrane protein